MGDTDPMDQGSPATAPASEVEETPDITALTASAANLTIYDSVNTITSPTTGSDGFERSDLAIGPSASSPTETKSKISITSNTTTSSINSPTTSKQPIIQTTTNTFPTTASLPSSEPPPGPPLSPALLTISILHILLENALAKTRNQPQPVAMSTLYPLRKTLLTDAFFHTYITPDDITSVPGPTSQPEQPEQRQQVMWGDLIAVLGRLVGVFLAKSRGEVDEAERFAVRMLCFRMDFFDRSVEGGIEMFGRC